VVVALAAVLSLFSIAEAQYNPTNPVNTAGRGSQVEIDPATANSGFLGFQAVNPTASSDAAATAAGAGNVDGTTASGAGGGLAITGSDTDLPLAIGVGLLALGGTAIVASRNRDDN